MKCLHCKNKAEVEYLENHLCNSCFSKMIEKRIRKYLRLSGQIHKDDSLLVVGDLCEYLLKRILGDLPIKMRRIDEKSLKNSYFLDEKLIFRAKSLKSKIVIPWTMDHENKYFIENFIEGKSQKYLGEKKPFIKLLKPITDQEAQIFARLKKVSYAPLKLDVYTKMFTALEEKYPSVRYALAGSVSEFGKIK